MNEIGSDELENNNYFDIRKSRGVDLFTKATGKKVFKQKISCKTNNLGLVKHYKNELRKAKQLILTYKKQISMLENKLSEMPAKISYNLGEVDCFSDEFKHVLIQFIKNCKIQKKSQIV